MSMNGSTPMTSLKILVMGALLMVVVGFLAWTFIVPHNTPTIEQKFNDGQILAGEGYVSSEVIPIAQAHAATPTPTQTPTIAPTPTPEPTPPPDSVYPRGNVVYVTPAPIIVLPDYADNQIYINEWNYVKTSGLRVEYPLKQNIQVKAGSSFKFALTVYNTKSESIQHMTGTLTAMTLNVDPAYNIVLPGFPMNIYDGRDVIGHNENTTLNRDMSIPNVKGHYRLLLTLQCDNGANAQIMQEVTVI